jgi:gephyrin
LSNESPKEAALLDAFGHSQAAREVYGCDFFRWKKKYPQKATFDQMRRYQETEAIHAVHKEDKTLKSGMTVAMTEEFDSKFKMLLEAGAFRSLCMHLAERSDLIQNIDLMTVSGFCRNCLAKWLVVEARILADTIRGVCQNNFTEEEEQILTSLDAFGYDQAAETVYGCSYKAWKEAHQHKATEEQITRFNTSVPIHAKHDKQLIANNRDYDANTVIKHEPTSQASKSSSMISSSSHWKPKVKSVPASDVCCEDEDSYRANSSSRPAPFSKTTDSNQNLSYRPPAPPRYNLSLKVGILTVSDRAAAGEYETGDLSGPAVEQALMSNIARINSRRAQSDITTAKVNFVAKAIVPDDVEEIKNHLLNWSGKYDEGTQMDIIFTTGGTGFSSRDVTPEATQEVLERECNGLMTFVLSECASLQPLAALSRGTAGICDMTLIVNLPGNPNGVGQCMDVLMPLLLHAVKDLKYV